MALNNYCTRLAANQTSNLALNDHVEFSIDGGTGGIATVSTGVGQAQGLITINQTGRFSIDIEMRMTINEGICELEVRSHPGTSPILDINGNPLVISVMDNFATDEASCSFNSSIFDLTSGDVIKLAFRASLNAVNATQQYCAFTMLELG